MFRNNSSSKSTKISVLELHKNAYRGFFNKFKEFVLYGLVITSLLILTRVYLEAILPVQMEEGSITSSEMFLVILFGVLFSVYFSLLLELIYKRITKSYLNPENKSFWFYLGYANKNLLKVSVIFFKSMW